MNFWGKNILIFGYGKSGQSALKLLKKIAKNIYIYDYKFSVNILNNNKKIKNNNYFNEKIIFFNNFNLILENKIHFCVISPGVDLDCEEVKLLKRNKIKIISELELGAFFCKGKIFAITGTNGKTTTVNLLYQIFKNAGKHTFLCGNVGTPITEIAQKTKRKSLIVCEVSSFQLETTNNFFPYASCILNLSPDHLNRHKTFENYCFIKNKINKNYKTKKIFNLDEKILKKYNNNYFNSINYSIKNNKYKNLINNSKLIGEFNKQNLICDCIMAKLENVSDKIIAKTIENFEGLPHRLKLVAESDNIKYINDSKSTNILSTLVALDTLGDNVILLLGGSEKELDFGKIFEGRNIATTIAFGETKQKIAEQAKNKNLVIKENFVDAVSCAFELALPNQTVLLSPACASFDEFTSYEARGKLFEKMVQEHIKSKK